MEEIWKDIPEYDGKYKISNTGKVLRCDYYSADGRLIKGKELSLYHGECTLYKDGKTKNIVIRNLLKDLFNVGSFPEIENELWEVIDGYNGKYLISNNGRVKMTGHYKINGEYVSERLLKPRNNHIVLIDDNGIHITVNIKVLLYDYFNIGKIEDYEGEIWKPINNFENMYYISNFGRVKRIECFTVCKNGKTQRNLPQIVKHDIGKRGYHRVPLYKNGKKYKYLVSRLVAEHFIPNPHNLPEVDHIDTDLNNNCVWNLRWVTHIENMNNEISMYKRSQIKNIKGKEVAVYKNGDLINKYISFSNLSKNSMNDFGFKITRSRINNIIDTENNFNGYYFRSV